jgi:hypothetical protein
MIGVLKTAAGWAWKAVKMLLGHADRQADRNVELAREETKRVVVGGEVAKAGIEGQVAYTTAAMNFWPFWLAWSIAALPCCLWFGLGMLDSALNGAGPDVAALPPQLAAIADKVFDSLFYSGATVGGIQAGAAVAGRLASAWGRR